MDIRLQEMLDHHEIRNVLALYCHACDRADADLMASVYTGDDSHDDHGTVKGTGPYYAQTMTEIIKTTTRVISHTLGQSIIQVVGDEAKAETFFLAFFTQDAEDATPRLSQLAGRFVDQLERREAGWRIKHRTAVHDLSITHKVEEDFLKTNGLARGDRTAADPGALLLGLSHAMGSTRGREA